MALLRQTEGVTSTEDLQGLLEMLRGLASETEWLEFKTSCAAIPTPSARGCRRSPIPRGCAANPRHYLVWGIGDESHDVVGTSVSPAPPKSQGAAVGELSVGQPDAERPHFEICEFQVEDKALVIFVVPPALHTPVRWREVEYIRVGSYTQKLRDYPEKERALWGQLGQAPFERAVALKNVSGEEVLRLLDYPAYFLLSGQPMPDGRKAILERLEGEKLIASRPKARFDITNLGATVFARDLGDFEILGRKAVRVIIYQGRNRIQTIKERSGPEAQRGYGAGFESLITYINDQLPRNEHLGQALRQEFKAYPEVAIRELVANALIHQDFSRSGESPLVEIFADRIEITNGGNPLIDTLRFLDEPPQSRNEILASLMRRLTICEERGSGVDKTVSSCEVYQLPAPDFRVTQNHTIAVLFSPRKLSQMDSKDKMRACYQHACLRWVSNDQLTNASLRERLGIAEGNYSIASRIIADTIREGLVKPYDPTSNSKKNARYVPFWA